MKAHSIHPAPHHDIAVIQLGSGWAVGAFESAEQEGGGHAQGDGDDGGAEVAFILVLVQAHAGAGVVAVDQAAVWLEVGESRFCCGVLGEF